MMQDNRVAAVVIACLAFLPPLPAVAASYKTLHIFDGSKIDQGMNPRGIMTIDALGNLYGITTYYSTKPTDGDGSIFKIDPKTGVLTTIHVFTGASDGRFPSGGLVMTSPNIMYGLAEAGGTFDRGTVFHIDLKTKALTADYQFPDNTAGTLFEAPMIVGKDGVLYGTAAAGGVGGDCGLAGGCGTIFTFDSATKTVTTLHAFVDGDDGAHPDGGLLVDPDGNYYGVAAIGGKLGGGVIYRIDPTTNTFSVVYSFSRSSAPHDPQGQLAAGSNGMFYGTTVENAQGPSSDLYSFDPASSQFTVLHQLDGQTEGFESLVGLTRSATGQLCGATDQGGRHDFGAVFCYDPVSSVSTVIRALIPSKTGAGSNPLVAGPSGKLYGTMSDSGFNNVPYGTVFAMRP